MRKVAKGAAVGVLAVGLFLAGGIGIGRVLRPDPVTVQPDAPASLAARPIIPSASLSSLIEQLQQRLEAAPEDWRSFASLGLAYVQQARVTADPSYYPKAEGALQQSLALQPEDNFEALLGMGALELARHDFTEALEHGEEALALNPHNGNVYGVIGDALVELGRYDEAFDTFQEMVDLRPDLASYARASYGLELQGRVGAARRAMELALSASLGSPDDAAWVQFHLGELAFGSGDLDDALMAYQQGKALAPDFLPNLAGVAKVAAARGDLDRAIRLYEQVVRRYPSIENVVALGDLYEMVGRDADAERQWQLVALQEDIASANGVNTDLEFALFHADHGLDVEAALDRARDEYARRRSVHVADALAWTLYANGRYQEALTYADEANALGYRNALFRFHRGMILEALGRDAEARASLEEALRINPYFSIRWAPVAHETLASLGAAA
jgi:pentatricopeptide repeat protein